jgi:hypothetical protein
MVCIPTALVPFFRIFFAQMQERGTWATREDWYKGYQAFVAIEEELMGCTGLQVMIDEQRRLYRLLDSVFNGKLYTAVAGGANNGGGGNWGGGGGGGGPWGGGGGGGGSWGGTDTGTYTPVPGSETSEFYFISPPLPPVPPDATLNPPPAPGLRARVERLLKLTDNMSSGRIYASDVQNPGEPLPTNNVGLRETITALQGVINAGWFGIGGDNATIADIVNALRIGSEPAKTSLLQTLQDILSAGSNIASIFGLVESLFADVAEETTEGAIVAVLIASTMASAAVAGQQQLATADLLTKLDLVLAALRGADAPADNILQALRGDEDASATRNVITVVS